MYIVICSDSEIDYHVVVQNYDGTFTSYFVDYKIIDKFLESLKGYENH